MFVADTGLHTIAGHAPSGELLLMLGTPGEPVLTGAALNMPTCAVQAPNGEILVRAAAAARMTGGAESRNSRLWCSPMPKTSRPT